MIRKVTVVLLLVRLAEAQSTDKDWAAVQRLDKRAGLAVTLRDGTMVRGALEKWTGDALVLSTVNGVGRFARQDVAVVRREKHSSRRKGALWGALIGFGLAFPIGTAAAGYLTDRNNPPVSTRIGMGAGFGMLGAGIGAGLGTLAGGPRLEIIYRAR